MATRLGFIGTGNIGNPMARTLQQADYDLTVCDLRREAAQNLVDAGAHFVATPREVAAQADVVLTSLPAPPQLDAVLSGSDGLLAGARPGLVHVDLSTMSLPAVRDAGEREAAVGARFIDAPVSGGKWAAESGKLTLMVSGDRSAFEAVEPVLETLGGNVFYLGEGTGTGTLFKLINNQVFLCAGQLFQEGLVLGAKAGLDLDKLLEVLKVSSAGMFCGLAAPTMARAWDESSYDLSLAEKDVRLALESARELGVPMPVTAASHQTFADAVADGLGAKFFIATLAALEERAGTKVPASPPDGG